MSVSLYECIMGLKRTRPGGQIALERDNVEGWRVIPFDGLQNRATVEQISAEINLLNEAESDTLIELISVLFQEVYPKSSIEEIVQREREYYSKFLSIYNRREYIELNKIKNQSLLFDIAMKEAAQKGERVSRFIKDFGITDEKMLYEIAKAAAAQSGWGVSLFIENYGITDQDKLYEIAKIAAGQNGEGVSENVQNYGITDQDKLYEIAKIAAGQNGWKVSEKIQKFGIKDKDKLYEIAKIAAGQDGYGVSAFIQNYGITDQDKLYEIAKIAAGHNGYGVSLFIEKFGITDQDMLYEIAKIAAGRNGLKVSENIQKFGIMDQDKRYEIAKIAAGCDGEGVSENVQNYGITDQDKLYEIAKIAAGQNGWKVSENIQKFGIMDQDKLYEIAKIAAAAQIGWGVSEYVQNFGIKDKDKLYEIVKIAAGHNGHGVSLFIENYGITDQDKLYEIAKIAAGHDGKGIAVNIQRFGVMDQNELYEIAKIAAGQNGFEVSAYIQKFGINSEDKRYEIAKIAAEQNGEGVSEHIQKYAINSEDKRYEIAKIAARQDAGKVSKNVQNFRINSEDKRYEIALTAADQNAGAVSRYINNFGIKDKKLLYKIALKAAARNGGAVSQYIDNFDIENRVMLYRIALTAAAQDGRGVSENIQNYGIKDKELLYKIALKAILQKPSALTNTLIDNYGLRDDLTSNLQLFRELLADSSKATEEHLKAFSDLIYELRNEWLPEFLASSLIKSKDPFVQNKLRTWIMDFFLENDRLTNKQIGEEQALFSQILELRNPSLRSQITPYLSDALSGSDTWDSLKALELKRPKKDLSLLACLLHLGHDREIARRSLLAFYSRLKDSFQQEVYIQFLLKIKELDQNSQKSLLDSISKQEYVRQLHSMRRATDIIAFGHPELLTGEEDLDKQLNQLFLNELGEMEVENFSSAYAKTLDQFRKKELIFTYLSGLKRLGKRATDYFKDIVTYILNGTFLTERYKVPHLMAIFEKFPELEKPWREGEKGLKEGDLLSGPLEMKVQNPISLTAMQEKIIKDKHLAISESAPLYRYLKAGGEREAFLAELNEMMKKSTPEEETDLTIQINCLKLLDSDLTDESRQNILGELEHLCSGQFQSDIKGWQAQLTPAAQWSDYLVSDTDDPNDLFLLGEEVSGSCQKITAGNPDLNQGVLGYMLNGYNRAVVVTDKSGAIVARSLLRLYWDGKRPVLYQERFYSRSSDPKLKLLVEAMCIRRAKAMGLPLVSAAKTDKRYPATLEIKGGRVDIEYVDAIGGIQLSKHLVKESYIIVD